MLRHREGPGQWSRRRPQPMPVPFGHRAQAETAIVFSEGHGQRPRPGGGAQRKGGETSRKRRVVRRGFAPRRDAPRNQHGAPPRHRRKPRPAAKTQGGPGEGRGPHAATEAGRRRTTQARGDIPERAPKSPLAPRRDAPRNRPRGAAASRSHNRGSWQRPREPRKAWAAESACRKSA